MTIRFYMSKLLYSYTNAMVQVFLVTWKNQYQLEALKYFSEGARF